MTPDRERKAAERARKSAAGLVRLELWAPTEEHQMAKQYAELFAALKELVRATPYTYKGTERFNAAWRKGDELISAIEKREKLRQR